MGIEFNADEVFEMAEQIERNGAKFYLKASAIVEDEATKKELLELSDWELRHERVFATMRTELSEKEKLATAFDPNGEAALYLQAMADQQVFDLKADPSKKLTDGTAPEAIYKMAIELEKDSIVFYVGIKAMVPKSLGEEKVDAIVREEMIHVSILRQKLKLLNK